MNSQGHSLVKTVTPSRTALSEMDLFERPPPRRVAEIMSSSLLSCPPGTLVCEAARLMRAAHCGSIVVMADGMPFGIWTERDAARLDFSDAQAFELPISAVMSHPVKAISNDAMISEAGVRFKNEQIRHLLVVDDAGRPCGMLSQTDVVASHGAGNFLTFRDVRSVISGELLVVPADMPLAQAARMISESPADAAVVTSPEWPDAGIVTERDLVRMIAQRRTGTVGDAASRPAVSVHIDTTLLVARNLFANYGFRHLLVRDDGGDVVGLLSFSDILEMLQHEYVEQINQALERSRKDLYLARQVIEASLDAVMIVDERGLIEYVNPAFTRMTGYTEAEALGNTPRFLESGRQDDAFYRDMWDELARTGWWQGEIWNRRKNGELFPVWQTTNRILDDQGHQGRYASVFSDITEKKQNEELIWHQANYDALTGLPNRRLFHDRLEQDLKKSHRQNLTLALLFIDLDRFKEVNDTLGHAAGDQLLREATRRITLCIRESDTVARLGGDEFMVILAGVTDPAIVDRVAEKLIHELERPFHLGADNANVSASVGIALYPNDALDADTLLKNADQAMYVAKSHGRSCFRYFTDSMQATAQARRKLSNELRDGLAMGRFELHIQPIVDLASNRLVQAEALLRWRHPERGLIGPSQFISVAEETGVINEIGDWVFQESARIAKRWCAAIGCPADGGCAVRPDATDGHAERCPVQICVNMSPRQFLVGNAPERWIDFLRAIDLPGHCLCIEITEGLLLDDRPGVIDKLKRLRAAGLQVALDDFGTGYSALCYLGKFPVDYLKIDESIVGTVATNPHDRAIAEAIVVMAHKLGSKVVAEGIESAAWRDVLAEAGCDLGQGYLFSPPLSVEDFLQSVASESGQG
jgi:diguanylate cyclase (GGDEF)-like protein/PAS domain S-box-containing protein